MFAKLKIIFEVLILFMRVSVLSQNDVGDSKSDLGVRKTGLSDEKLKMDSHGVQKQVIDLLNGNYRISSNLFFQCYRLSLFGTISKNILLAMFSDKYQKELQELLPFLSDNSDAEECAAKKQSAEDHFEMISSGSKASVSSQPFTPYINQKQQEQKTIRQGSQTIQNSQRSQQHRILKIEGSHQIQDMKHRNKFSQEKIIGQTGNSEQFEELSNELNLRQRGIESAPLQIESFIEKQLAKSDPEEQSRYSPSFSTVRSIKTPLNNQCLKFSQKSSSFSGNRRFLDQTTFEEKTFENITVRGMPLTTTMIERDPKLRWKLLMELFRGQRASTENSQLIGTDKENPHSKILLFQESPEPACNELLNIEQEVESQKLTAVKIAADIEFHLKEMNEKFQTFKKAHRQRRAKELLVIREYQSEVGSLLKKYLKSSKDSITENNYLYQKRIKKTSAQVLKCNRVQKSQSKERWQALLNNIEKTQSSYFQRIRSEQNQFLLNMKDTFTQRLQTLKILQSRISQLNSKNIAQVQSKRRSLETCFEDLLKKEEDQRHQMESSMRNVLKSLQSAVQSTFSTSSKD